MLPHTLINRVYAAIAGISDAETATANAAEEQTLQEAQTFAHGTSEPFAIGAIGRQTLPVDDELVGGDIAIVMIGDHDAPGVLRHQA